jgi:hypothetical protein
MEKKEFYSLICSLEEVVPRILSTKVPTFEEIEAEVLSLQQPVMYESTFRFRNFEKIEVRGLHSKNDLVTLVCLSWWMPELIGTLIRLAVEDEFSVRQRSEDLALLVLDKRVYFFILFSDSRFSDRWIQSILSEKNLQEVLDRLRIRKRFIRTSRPKRLQRHKGYRDKGTLPSIDERALRLGITEDVTFQEKQNKREEYLSSKELYLECHRSWLKSLGSSLDPDSCKFYLKEDYNYDRKIDCSKIEREDRLQQEEVRECREEDRESRTRERYSEVKDQQSSCSFTEYSDEELEEIILLLELPEE